MHGRINFKLEWYKRVARCNRANMGAISIAAVRKSDFISEEAVTRFFLHFTVIQQLAHLP